MIYLAAPYTDSDADIQSVRLAEFSLADAALCGQGLFIVSPMSKIYSAQVSSRLPTTWEYWEGYAKDMMSHCEELIVLVTPGTNESKGVQGEIAMAKQVGIPIRYCRFILGSSEVEFFETRELV